MTGNISKSKGFKGARGDTGPRGPQGEKGDTANLHLRYNQDTGDLYYTTEHIPSITTAPYIGDNGNWYVFDGISQTFVDSGINAQGGVPKKYIDEYLDKQTAIIKSDIEGLQKHINEESHFRGYLLTNAEIQSMEATPNDFAYSAESGTKWIYDAKNGWKDSGVEVPNDPIPASNKTPLIDGVATAGSSEEYARGDHRHPTDTTRASVEALNTLKNDMKPFEVNIYSYMSNGTVVYKADKTFAEIIEAHYSDKNIVAVYDDIFLPIVFIDNRIIIWTTVFASYDYPLCITINLYSSGDIEVMESYCEALENRVDEIPNEPQYNQYPTAIAVKNYVDDRLSGQSAEIEEAIDRIISIQNSLIGGDGV